MANEQNLIPFSERTESEQREIRSEGGKASGVSASSLMQKAAKEKWNEEREANVSKTEAKTKQKTQEKISDALSEEAAAKAKIRVKLIRMAENTKKY